MKAEESYYCWACQKEIPAGNFTRGGRHDEEKGGCGCYIDTATSHRTDPGKTREQVAFEAGWKACESLFDPCSEIGGAPLQMEVDYKKWKEEQR